MEKPRIKTAKLSASVGSSLPLNVLPKGNKLSGPGPSGGNKGRQGKKPTIKGVLTKPSVVRPRAYIPKEIKDTITRRAHQGQGGGQGGG